MVCDTCGQTYIDGRSDDSGDYCESCYKKWFKKSALEAGVPESVVDGKTQLSDHFSEDYIDYKCGNKDE